MKIIATVLGAILLVFVALGVGGWLYLRAPDLRPGDLAAKYGRANSRYADLPGGVRLHYLDSGAPGGPPIILIHGFGDNSFSWDGWTQVLGKTHRVLAIDLPGHGLTVSPANFAAAADRYADLVEQFAGALGLGPAVVAGNSMGGGVAWQLALRHPERVSRLVLVDAAGWPNPNPGKPPLAFRVMQYGWGRAFLASIDNTPLIREGLRKDVVDPAVLTEPFIQRWADLQRMPGHRPILMSLRPGSLAASPAALAAIKVPTLILWGEADRILDVEGARRFHAAIPQSKLIVYPRVGHLPQWEAPERSAGDVAAWLGETRG